MSVAAMQMKSEIGTRNGLRPIASSIAPIVHRQDKTDLRSDADRAVRRDEPVVREHGLPRDREAEPRAAGFRRDVRIPDAGQLVAWNAAAGIRYRDLHQLAPRQIGSPNSYADMSAATFAARVHRIEHHVRQRSRKRFVMPVDHRYVGADVDVDLHFRRDRCPRGVADELADVDLSAWSLRESTELREAARHGFEALRLRLEHIDGFGEVGGRIAPQPRHGESDGRERVFQLMCDLTRALSKRGGALGLEGACATKLELAGHLPHPSAKYLELGS